MVCTSSSVRAPTPSPSPASALRAVPPNTAGIPTGRSRVGTGAPALAPPVSRGPAVSEPVVAARPSLATLPLALLVKDAVSCPRANPAAHLLQQTVQVIIPLLMARSVGGQAAERSHKTTTLVAPVCAVQPHLHWRLRRACANFAQPVVIGADPGHGASPAAGRLVERAAVS
eukprot:scaffold19631_cov90-Isochrysis_galbana.AAC.2